MKVAKASMIAIYESAKRKACEKIVMEVEHHRNDAKICRKLYHLKGLPSQRTCQEPQQQAEHLDDELANRTSRNNLPYSVNNILTNLALIRGATVANALAQSVEIHDQDFTIQELNKVL